MATKKGTPIYGVGINDADYLLYETAVVEGKNKVLWRCPFYTKWFEMVRRCYSDKFQQLRPSYIGCSVTSEWHSFMSFRAWMFDQDWETKELDKDILFPGNKLYGPDACVFVDKAVNLFLGERKAGRGEWPIGVSFRKDALKYQARAWDVVKGKQVHLGLFKDPQDAHKAWLKFKLSQARILASEQTDNRIAQALINRYENYAPV